MVQYGVEKQRDSNWSFCTPAISAGYPRWWRPDEMKFDHQNRPQHRLDNTGEFLDAFDNYAYVYCVGNPEVGKEQEPIPKGPSERERIRLCYHRYRSEDVHDRLLSILDRRDRRPAGRTSFPVGH